MTNLTDPIFNDEAAAIAHFERIRWPNGPVCPRCGTCNEATLLKGKTHRVGMYQCNACRKPFSVKVGSVMESSHIPMHKWALGFHLMAASKKGMSAHQLHRMLGVTYKSAWFMAHRIREAMGIDPSEPMGGNGGTVEIDETYIGKDKSIITETTTYSRLNRLVNTNVDKVQSRHSKTCLDIQRAHGSALMSLLQATSSISVLLITARQR